MSRTGVNYNTRNHIVSKKLRRECFVTVGATASFRALINEVTSKAFLETLSSLGYSHLTIQCGPDLQYAREFKLSEDELEALRTEHKLDVTLFDYNAYGLGEEMKGCKRRRLESTEGVVISHAGAGTILDAMRLDVPIVVVPNPELLDNHQEELARALDLQGYVTYGDLTDLPTSLKASEVKNSSRRMWAPVNSNVNQERTGLVECLDEELGYETHMREILD